MIQPSQVAARGYLLSNANGKVGGGGGSPNYVVMPPPPPSEEAPEVVALKREARQKTYELKKKAPPHIETMDFEELALKPLDYELMIELVNVEAIAVRRKAEDELLLWAAID